MPGLNIRANNPGECGAAVLPAVVTEVLSVGIPAVQLLNDAAGGETGQICRVGRDVQINLSGAAQPRSRRMGRLP